MKKNLYYQILYRRTNFIKEFILGLFMGISSWPRLLLEVFIRKNMGERYFSFSTSIIIAIILALLPFQIAKFHAFFSGQFSFWDVLLKNIAWYIYLIAFLYHADLRRQEVKRLPSVFDFARFSLSTGNINPQFYNFSIDGTKTDVRTVETLLEPALFFIVGFFLAIIGQSLGFLLLICSVIYSLSYVAAYHLGDNFVMDTIDEMICNEELVASFVEGMDSSQTRGFNSYGRKPSDPDMRRRVVDDMTGGKNTEDIEFEEVK